MSHMLDSMFSVRETPWHGLGTILADYPQDWAEARREAGLEWEPIARPVYVNDLQITETGELSNTFAELDHFTAIQRDDNGYVLAVMNKTYEIFPNADLGPLLEEFVKASGGRLQYETAGSLDHGRDVWALLREPEPFQIPGDPNGAVLPFLAAQNSHDGGGALRIQRLQTRIVCKNTSMAADREAEKHGLSFTFRHTKSIGERVEQAKRVVAGLDLDTANYREWAADLLSLKVSAEGKRAFVEAFIPMPVAEVITPRVHNNIESARAIMWGYLNGVTCEGISDTAYGLTQAGIEFLDHGRNSRSSETKFRRCMLSVEPMKRQAEKFAREAALV